ncbi:MAG: family 16 glycosylhydrolase [Tenuifilum sp.]|uniref:family 16 glycosylhydrolase n=1 Tax=Tenuifilum sp. TaxID=2760880 RepID=UPI001B59869E|nr:family 16 glycosylhydrolase [Bacteroidales bacterium]HOK60005.1 family 16 glycosylhydrolase [Tenuifilum sp.]MBP9028440.1 family 16 glycosylhydrolase [Bacteroidales bacterium]HOK84773.1 family 16 glycosylhydrolase [Tenuifilum sp.]HON69431.1 family 16 glycosylhydrolase [Tenuifilum sp.]
MSRKFINSIIALLLVVPFTSLAQVKVLVWNDEFNYTGLPATDKWGYDVGGGGWGNNELQYYTNARTENARVENGNLVIEARKEQYEGSEYTSARLVTRYKGDWLYGRVETYAKLPSGTGTWPAIWMLPTNWVYGSWPKSGEIDIMEYVGYDPGVVHGSIHTEAYNHVLGTQKTATISVPDAETAFHLYALEWTPEKIDIYVDNNKYFTFDNEHKDYKTWPFDQVFHLILNIAVGGNWGGAQGVDPNIWPQKMYVDYVRVYQYIDVSALKVSGPEYVSPNQTGVTFSIQNVADATFSWSVPAGATIVSGQGTNSIVVNWGDVQGDVSVEITHPQAGGTYTKTVKTAVIPTGDRFSLLNVKENGLIGWAGLNTSPNTITLSAVDTLLKVKYNITKPEDFPYFTYTFQNPVDMSNLTVLNVEMMTYNQSKSVVMRADLFDTDGRLTDVSPVFRFYPVEPHGVFHYYSFDFNNNWGSNTPEYGKQVNYHQIAGVRFYVNYGVYGKAASDSLWISDVVLSNTLLTIFSPSENKISRFDIYPNPASTYIKINSSALKGNVKIQVINIAGVLVKEIIENSDGQINISDLPNGFYSVRIITHTNLLQTGSFIKL